jgi:tape measure domain-containing protein
MADLTRTVAIIFEGEDRVTVATDKIARTFSAVGTEATGAASKVDQLDGELDSLEKRGPGISSVSDALKALAASLVLKAFIDANVEAEKFTKTLTLLKGSSEVAAQEFEFVKDTANRLGLEIGSTASAYAGLTAATNGTNLQGQGTRDIFEAVAQAMAALGRSSDETSGAFLAITQIVSKGRVSLEELSGQLGERLPGALQIAARGLGLTTSELIKLVESGGLTAQQFLPAFARELDATFAGATFDGYVASLARLKNGITEAFLVLGDSGAFDVLIKGVQTGTAAVVGSVQAFTLLGEIIGAFFAKISLGSSFDFGAAVAASVDKAANATRGANDALLGVEKTTKAVAEAGTVAGNSLVEGLGKGALTGDALKKSLAEVDKSLRALGIDPKLFSEPVIELSEAFKSLATNASATGEQIVTGLIGALQKLPQDASLDEFRRQVAFAFRDGKLTAEEYAQALALIDTKQKGLSPSFGPVSDAARKQAEELTKTAEATKKAAEEADKYRLELEKIASNERIANIEAKITLNIAQLEADTERVKAAFSSIDNTVNSTGDLLGDLFSLFKDFDNLSFGAIRIIESQIELENERRQQALDLQKKLTEAQIAQIRAQTQALEKGDSIIKIDGAGLQPHLEAFMWEILRTIQVRVNQDGLGLLLGV